MRAWLIDDSVIASQGRTALAERTPSEAVTEATLAALGVLYWHFDPATEMKAVEQLQAERSYKNRDEVRL